MSAYYNEIDPKAAAWLRELIKGGHIAAGDVDERSIADVQPDDLISYTQCHFFAGIGGWSYALRLAGWPDDRPVWTGSCPCTTHSTAARGKNTERDWWPYWQRLIAAKAPTAIFSEQVANVASWFDVVLR
jgi:DNA (cytosine-5)-methyltransferase 1